VVYVDYKTLLTLNTHTYIYYTMFLYLKYLEAKSMMRYCS